MAVAAVASSLPALALLVVLVAQLSLPQRQVALLLLVALLPTAVVAPVERVVPRLAQPVLPVAMLSAQLLVVVRVVALQPLLQLPLAVQVVDLLAAQPQRLEVRLARQPLP